jgi:hypothetical protein
VGVIGLFFPSLPFVKKQSFVFLLATIGVALQKLHFWKTSLIPVVQCSDTTKISDSATCSV